MLQTRKDQAVGLKREYTYKTRNSAAMKIQSWYRRVKAKAAEYEFADRSGAVLSSEDKTTESGSLDDLQYNIDDEVAIALALVNQRPLSSLTEYQQEKVRKLRAGVADSSNHSGTNRDQNSTRTTPSPKSTQNNRSKTSHNKPSSVIAEKKKVIIEKPVETTTQLNVKKLRKKKEPVAINQKKLTDPNEAPANILRETEPETFQTASEEQVKSLDVDSTNTQFKKALKSTKPTQIEQGIGRFRHSKRSPQKEKVGSQNVSTRNVKVKSKHKQEFVGPMQQTVTKLHPKSLKDDGKQIHKVPSNKKEDQVHRQPKSDAVEQSKLPSFKQSQNSIQLNTQYPLQEADARISPTIPLAMVSPIPQYRETDGLKTNKEDSKLYNTEWEEPATPEENPSFLFHCPNTIKEQPTILPSSPTPSQDFREENNKQLKHNESALALINFAQELVIKDFLEWKRGPVSTIPSNGHLSTHTTVQSESTNQHPAPAEYADSKRNKSQNSTSPSVQLSPNVTPNQPGTPLLASDPDMTTIKSLPLSPVHRKNFVTTHKPKLKNKKAWKSTHNVLPPRMVDTAVQTDFIEDFSAANSVILLPPVSARGVQRPHNAGGHSRPGRVSNKDRKAAKKDKSIGEDVHMLKKDKRSLFNFDKKPIKSLKSPSLNPIPRKIQHGYLGRYLHSDSLSGPIGTQSAPGEYMQSNHDQYVSWYGGLNNTAPPSILPGNSPLHFNRSYQASQHMKQKLPSESYQIHHQRMNPLLKPLQHPTKMHQIGPPPGNKLHKKQLSDDQFQTLDSSSYQYQYKNHI